MAVYGMQSSITNMMRNSVHVQPYIGILSTPVIDNTTNTVYCMPYTKEKGVLTYRWAAVPHRADP